LFQGNAYYADIVPNANLMKGQMPFRTVSNAR